MSAVPSLIETMRFEPAGGIVRQSRHLDRLTRSAATLGLPGADQAGAALGTAIAELSAPKRVRLELFADGRIDSQTAPFTPLPEGTVWRLALAPTVRLSSRDPLLRHKTSLRSAYDAARAEVPKDLADEVLLLNEAGEICEGTITSVFLDDGSGRLLTPPLASGCLAGVLRASLLASGKARTARLTPTDLAGRTLYVGNSLRGLIKAELVTHG